MSKEIERKFRVTKIDKKLLKKGTKIIQGYLSISPEVRVRIKGNRGFLTVKSEGDIERKEYEYRIPLKDAKKLLQMCRWKLEKTRYKLRNFEIDIFKGKLKGLILAEIELTRKDHKVTLPSWLDGYEVTYEKSYKNKYLAKMKDVTGLS